MQSLLGIVSVLLWSDLWMACKSDLFCSFSTMLLPCSLVKRMFRTCMLRVTENPNENTSRGMDRATPQTDSSQTPQNPKNMKKQKQKHFFQVMGDKNKRSTKKSSASSFFCCRCLYFFGCCLWQKTKKTLHGKKNRVLTENEWYNLHFYHSNGFGVNAALC